MTLSICPACRVGLERCLVCGGARHVWTLDAAERREVWRATYASAFASALHRGCHGLPGLDGTIDARPWADRTAREAAEAAVRALTEWPMPTCERSE